MHLIKKQVELIDQLAWENTRMHAIIVGIGILKGLKETEKLKERESDLIKVKERIATLKAELTTEEELHSGIPICIEHQKEVCEPCTETKGAMWESCLDTPNNTEKTSSCCVAGMIVEGETTKYYVCKNCGKPCDMNGETTSNGADTKYVNIEETPMGFSAWLAHGKKYGYSDYYKEELIKRVKDYNCGEHKKLLDFINKE